MYTGCRGTLVLGVAVRVFGFWMGIGCDDSDYPVLPAVVRIFVLLIGLADLDWPVRCLAGHRGGSILNLDDVLVVL